MNPVSPKPSRSGSSSSINEDSSENLDVNDGSSPPESKNNFAIDDIKVKVCDFSFSQIMTPGKPILGMMGTVAYSGNFSFDNI